MINKPLLPPKEGYVEVVNANGEHVYKPLNSTLQKQVENKNILETKQILNALLNVEGGQENNG